MQVFVLTFLSDCDQIHDRRHVAARVPDRPRAQGVQCDHAGRSTRAYVPAKIQNRKTVSFCYAGTINTDVLFGLTKKALASRPESKNIRAFVANFQFIFQIHILPLILASRPESKTFVHSWLISNSFFQIHILPLILGSRPEPKNIPG